jgi:uncharacterized protein (DUF849 family)
LGRLSRFPFPAHPLTPFEPLIINAALTGMTPQRSRSPHVPLTSEEIADDAERCFRAGASVLHLHARDADGGPAWQRSAYEDMIVAIRRRCPGVVVCVTTSGRGGAGVDQRSDVLQLDGDARPDLASLTLGSINFPSGASVNDVATIEDLAGRMAERGVVPELELFDLGMAHLAHRLRERRLLPAACPANLLLGFPNGAPADARSLVALVDALPACVSTWNAAGFGAFQQPAGALAAAIGGNIRTGLEDNPFLDHVARSPATNAQLVERAVLQARAAGREVADAPTARRLIGLAPAPALTVHA